MYRPFKKNIILEGVWYYHNSKMMNFFTFFVQGATSGTTRFQKLTGSYLQLVGTIGCHCFDTSIISYMFISLVQAVTFNTIHIKKITVTHFTCRHNSQIPLFHHMK